MASQIDPIEEDLILQFKLDLIEAGAFIEGDEVEDEVRLQELWGSLLSRFPELSGRMGILLISKALLQGASQEDIIGLIKSIVD